MTNEPANDKKPRTQRLALWLLMLVFIVPLAAAYLLYFGGYQRSGLTVNHGDLIQPSKSFDEIPLAQVGGAVFDKSALRGRWVMLFVSPGRCDNVCQDNLYKIRQTRTSLGKYAHRVNIVLVTPVDAAYNQRLASVLKKKYPQIKYLISDKKVIAHTLTQWTPHPDTKHQGHLFIVDPNGNVMMHYSQHATFKGIRKDLKRLLRLSQIG